VRANPASLAEIGSVSASAFVLPALFGMSELRTMALSLGAPVGPAAIGGSISRFGFDLYHETGVSLAGAARVIKSVCLGAALHALSIGIARYGQSFAWKADVGLIATLGEDLRIGVAVRPLVGELPSLEENRFTRSLLTAISYSPLSGSLLHLELEQEQGFAPAGKLGLEQVAFDVLTIRSGVATLPESFSAGLGLRLGLLEFGYALWSHRDLGWSHAFEVRFGEGVMR